MFNARVTKLFNLSIFDYTKDGMPKRNLDTDRIGTIFRIYRIIFTSANCNSLIKTLHMFRSQHHVVNEKKTAAATRKEYYNKK